MENGIAEGDTTAKSLRRFERNRETIEAWSSFFQSRK